MRDLLNIKYWLFDLDNTLYSGDTKVFDQVDKRMSKYISSKLNVSIEKAKKIQKNYFHEYNTTLNGMIKNHEIDAKEFLDFVHDIDLEFLKNDKGLELELSKIKDKKIIFTNGSRAHAENVTKRIGINSASTISKMPSKSRSIPICLVTFIACFLEPLVNMIFLPSSFLISSPSKVSF